MSRCVRYEHFSASALVALRALVGWPSSCSRPTDGWTAARSAAVPSALSQNQSVHGLVRLLPSV